MTNLKISAAAAGLLRALIARAHVERDRILLMECRSVDWQSLTYVGERHEIDLRILPPGAEQLLERLTMGLEECEFTIPGHIVADIAVDGTPEHGPDGSLTLSIEALTIAQ